MTKADPEFTCLCIYQWSGERGQNILDKATFSEADLKNWEKHLEKLEEHCKPRGSKLVAATQYKVLTQGDMELPEYIEKCRQITDACGWPENAKDMALRNAILLGLKNPMVYQKCLEENQDTLTADRVIEIATDIYNSDCQRSIMQTLSTASAAATAIQQGSTQVHKLQENHQEDGKSEKGHGKNFTSQDKDGMKRQDCYCCGARPAHPKSKCPAKDVICHNCGKKGHYQKCCKSKRAKPGKNRKFKQTQVHDLQTQPVDGNSQSPINPYPGPYLPLEPPQQYSSQPALFHHIQTYHVKSINDTSSKHIKPLWLSAASEGPIHQVECEIDTGAGCNVMPLYMYKSLFGDKELMPTSVQIFGYGESPIANLGACIITIHTSNKQPQMATCQVTDTRGYLILGRTTAQQVGYIDFPVVTPPALTRVPQVHTSVNALRPNLDEVKTPICEITNDAVILNGKRHCLPITKEYVLSEFKDVFEGIGKLPGGKYHIELKPDAQPVQHPPRAVPEKKKEAYKDELERLCSLGIIEPVAGHTDWINSIVPVAKPDGSIRLCLDPKDLNKSIKRNQYYSKTIDEVSAELHDSRYFTVVDAKSGYWMVELDSESSLLTTFNTPWGKYKWLRLPFGLKVSSDVFQERLNSVLQGVKGITGCVDDVLARGVDSKDHDVNVLRLLETARMNGIKFNPKKLQFKSIKCEFFGHTLTPEGMKIDDRKVEAIKQMSAPKDKKGLQSFQGMINYLKRYSVKLMKLSEPLKPLLREDVEWTWDSTHQDAFDAIKEELTKTPVLAYFNPKSEHVIQTDASLKGLGAVLLQEGRPVIYVSRTLTPAEEHYSNIERELLGVVFAMERLHNYVYGEPVRVQTDHKPLETIWKKRIATASPRLQRLLLRLARYEIQLEYIRGKDNSIADALSRVDPLSPEPQDAKQMDTIPVHQITNAIPATDNRLDRTRIATTADPTLNQLRHYIFHGWPLQKCQLPQPVQHYWNYREELAIEDGLIFKAHRLVIPTSQRAEYLKDLHAGHLGEEKTLLRARETVFWPGISDDIRNAVKACDICQKHKPAQQKEPLTPHDVPSMPWVKLGIDLFEHRSHHYLLVADYFSKFPIVKKLSNQTSGHVIGLLKTIFAEYGIPTIVYTDQGTQFASEEFRAFAVQYRFQVQHSSPRYPQSNGFIEAMVKTAKNIMEKAEESGSDPHLAMLIYRSTPIRPGQLSPAELLTQRKYRALLPIHQYLHPNLEKSREAQIAQKQTQADYYNQKAKQLQDLKQYQNVRVQLDPNKPIWQKATVVQQPTDRSPRRYQVQTESGARYFRNRRHLRPAIQSDQPEDLIGQPATSAESLPPTSPHTNTVNRTLPTQCAQDHTHPSIAASRPRRTVGPRD